MTDGVVTNNNINEINIYANVQYLLKNLIQSIIDGYSINSIDSLNICSNILKSTMYECIEHINCESFDVYINNLLNAIYYIRRLYNITDKQRASFGVIIDLYRKEMLLNTISIDKYICFALNVKSVLLYFIDNRIDVLKDINAEIIRFEKFKKCPHHEVDLSDLFILTLLLNTLM